MEARRKKRKGKLMFMALAVAVAAILVPTIVFAQGTADSAESGAVAEIYGSANGWNNNAAWVGFALAQELDLSSEKADVKISYEYIENGEIKTVTSVSSGSVYQKNKFWDGYLTDINQVKYSALDENKVLPANTIIQSNLSASAKNGLDVTAKIQSGDVQQVRTVVEVIDAQGVSTIAKSNWVTYSTDLNYSAPKGISKEVVVAYEQNNPGIRFDAAALIGEREFVSLQSALAAAQDGDTILLKNGTHEGNIVIEKNIKIQGESKEGTIIAANENTGINGHTGYIIHAKVNVELENLTVDGKKLDLAPVHRLETGIYAEKGLKVNNVDIINIGCGAERPLCGVQTGIGIYADTPAASPNTEDVLIQNVTLSDFQKAGLVIKTTGDVLIENTVITGSGATDIIAQNGIQINNTENAVINNSVVSGINYTGDVNACGVLLVGGAQAQVNDCTFEDVKQNVSCYDDECAAYVKDGDEVTVITTQHQAVMTPEKAPGCTEDGNKAYWYCAHCDKYFGDAELTVEINLEDTILKATGHNYKDGVCTVCGDKDATYVPPQNEGDFGTVLFGVLAAVLLAGAIGAAAYIKKVKAGR